MSYRATCLIFAFLSLASFAVAQETATNPASSVTSTNAAATNSVVPRLVRFGAAAKTPDGKPLTGTLGVTFYLYKDEQGGAPLWMETQNVQTDAKGNYSVQLGAASPEGLPTEVFASGDARWLAVQISGQTEQPRVLLLAVPYALKAADAATVGGLPPSAFVLAAPQVGSSESSTSSSASAALATAPNASSDVTTTGGTANTIPMFTTKTNIQNSILTQTGTTSVNVVGTLNLPSLGTATASKGFNSQAQNFVASAYNSSSAAAVAQTFQLQAEPLNNDKSTAAGTLNLLYGKGTAKPTETGLSISSKGVITFASGQMFPGTGDGTITGVTAGTDLTGGGTSGNVTLALNTTATNALYARLAANNTFSGVQTVNNTMFVNAATSAGALQVTNTVSSGSGPAVNGITNSTGSSGVRGDAVASSGPTNGVYGISASSQGFGVKGTSPNVGVLGVSTSDFVNAGWGVEGQSATNVGVYGSSAGSSSTGSGNGTDAGVWGDTGNTSAFTYTGVLGTADNAQGGAFYNNGVSYAALSAVNFTSDTSAIVFSSGLSTFCFTDVGGNLFCTGSKSAVVPVDGGSRHVALYAVEAPENWFEDAGSAQLSRGQAVVSLEPIFGQAVNTGIEYHVFLTPKGDCRGLYVAEESPTSFVVRELGSGSSSVAFDYRIMAKRKGYENIRLADKTKQIGEQETRNRKMNLVARPGAAAGVPKASAQPIQTIKRTAAEPR